MQPILTINLNSFKSRYSHLVLRTRNKTLKVMVVMILQEKEERKEKLIDLVIEEETILM